jgi:hypothetical protein
MLAQQQQPTPMLLSLLLTLCKLTRVYAPGDFRLALALSGSVLNTCMETSWPTDNSDGSSSSNSSSQVLPVCGVLARGLHCHAYALEQAACHADTMATAAALPYSLSLPQALHCGEVIGTAVTALTEQLCRSAVPGIAAVVQKQLKQQGDVVRPGIEAALQDGSASPEQLQQWAQQLQQFAAAAVAAVPLAAACNNPCCVGLEWLSEGQLVKGRRCSRCKAGYCSDACQVAHWQEHRKACKLLAAAGARAWA